MSTFPYQKTLAHVATAVDFICYEFFDNPNDPESSSTGDAAIATLDIGGDTSNLVVSCPDLVWFRGIGGSGNEFTKSLVQSMGLTFAQAEQLKQAPTASNTSRIYNVLQPVFSRLLNEVDRSLNAFSKDHSDREIQRLLGIGGGMQLHGLLRCLRCGINDIDEISAGAAE